jgi:hypothetical protein
MWPIPDEGSDRGPVCHSATAAAVALVVGSSGAFRSVATHELVSAAELVDVLRKAAAARPGYARPGE